MLLGNGNGTLKAPAPIPTNLNPTAVAIGDLTGDGKPDIVVSTSLQAVILLGDGNGSFQAPQIVGIGYNPTTVALGDLNGDGNLDLVLPNVAHGRVLLGNGNGTFQAAQQFGAGSPNQSVAIGDVNGDGKPDLVLATPNYNAVGVLLGNGNGTFQAEQTFATGVGPQSVVLGDFTGNGNLDIAVADNGVGAVSVLLGNGNGTFQAQQTYTTGISPDSVAVGDLTGDGELDLAVANSGNNTVSVLLGNGNGTFQAQQTFATGNEPTTVLLGDLNGDGRLDLIAVNKSSNSVSVLLSNGNGSFIGQVYAITTTATTHFAITGLPPEPVAGSTLTFTVEALDQSNNVVPNYTGTVQFDTTDIAAAAVVPADYQFVPADDGVHVFTVGSPLVTAGTQTMTAFDEAVNAIAGSATVTVVAAAASQFVINAPGTVSAMRAFNFTVTALDPYGNKPSGYAGTLHFSSSDSQAVLPADMTLTNDVAVFTAIFKASGSQSITAVDTSNSTVAGTSNAITVIGPATHLAIDALATVSINSVFNFIVTAEDAFGNTAIGYTGTVDFTSSDSQALLPIGTALTNGEGTFSATLKSLGSVTLTATDSGNAAITGSAAILVVTSTLVPWPFVQALNITSVSHPSTGPDTVVYTVTFSEAVTDVTIGDFTLALTGNEIGTVTQLTTVNASVYTVTVSGITGTGTLGLNLVDNGTIHDLAGQGLTQQNAPLAFQPQQTLATGLEPSAVTLGDVNGDGISDIVLADTGSNAVSVLIGNGNGTFQAQQTVARETYALSLSLADVNGDGIPDLVVGSLGTAPVRVLLGNGNGTFQAQQTFGYGVGSSCLAVGDVNGDGNLDIVLNINGYSNGRLLLGNGNGTFQAQQTIAIGNEPDAMALADLTNDGKLDLVIGTYNGMVDALLGNGNGTFQAPQTFASGTTRTSVAIGDVNGDGIPDLVVADYRNNAVSVLLGNGNGTFQAQQYCSTGSVPTSVVLGDFTGDGKPDIAVVNELSGTVSVLLGNGNGTFQTQQTFAVGNTPDSLAVGDFSGDGHPDLVATNRNDNTISVLLNNANGNFTGQVYTSNATHLVVGGTPATTPAGGKATLTVTALDPFNEISYAYTGTVHFSTTDTGFSVLLPADYTFVPRDHGVHVFTGGLTLITPGSQTVTATDTVGSSITGNAVVTVKPVAFVFVGFPTSVEAGAAFLLDVVAQNQAGNTVTGYAGVVHFSSTDPHAQIPTDTTLTGGVGVFAVELRTAGYQTFTATANNGNGTSAVISVGAVAADRLAVSASSRRRNRQPRRVHRHRPRSLRQCRPDLCRNHPLHQQRQRRRIAFRQHAHGRPWRLQRNPGISGQHHHHGDGFGKQHFGCQQPHHRPRPGGHGAVAHTDGFQRHVRQALRSHHAQSMFCAGRRSSCQCRGPRRAWIAGTQFGGGSAARHVVHFRRHLRRAGGRHLYGHPGQRRLRHQGRKRYRA